MTTTQHVPDNPAGNGPDNTPPPMPPHWAPVPRLSALAVAAFACSVFGVFPVAIAMGLRARREIDRSEGRLDGRGLATAAIVIGWLTAALFATMITWLLMFPWDNANVQFTQSCTDSTGLIC